MIDTIVVPANEARNGDKVYAIKQYVVLGHVVVNVGDKFVLQSINGNIVRLTTENRILEISKGVFNKYFKCIRTVELPDETDELMEQTKKDMKNTIYSRNDMDDESICKNNFYAMSNAVDLIMENSDFVVSKPFDNYVVVSCKMFNGTIITETCSAEEMGCFDEDTLVDICRLKISEKIRAFETYYVKTMLEESDANGVELVVFDNECCEDCEKRSECTAYNEDCTTEEQDVEMEACFNPNYCAECDKKSECECYTAYSEWEDMKEAGVF